MYKAANGKLRTQTKLKFKKERLDLLMRVFQESDLVFVTCNNAGSEIVSAGFDPGYIVIDEAGQLTMAGLANVFKSFLNWLAATIFGDPNQLRPFIPSGKYNEFLPNAETSVLELLAEKDYPMLRLILQYRMAPAISQWVSTFFYKGLLQNHPSVLVDNIYRRAAREISKEFYGIDGPDGKGSEYWMINVANGVSQARINSTSLQNHANADRLAILVDQTLAKGVPLDKIKVLAYYTGQIPLVCHKIEQKAAEKGRSWEYGPSYQISSVDAFQGEENEFVFVDIVVAHHKANQTADTAVENDPEEGPEGSTRSGTVTGHVKSPNRLCCALTRGRSCVVVIGQLSAIFATVQSTRPLKATAAISAMAKDLVDRKFIP